MVIEDLTDDECVRALTSARVGHLACAHENRPYVVPISFAYHAPSQDEAYLYGFTTHGQKVEWMRTNPQVCVECDDVKTSDQWTSVVVFGHFYELTYTPQWEHQLLHAQELLKRYSAWWQPGAVAHAASVHRIGPVFCNPIFYRIRIEQMTGRRARPENHADGDSGLAAGLFSRLFQRLAAWAGQRPPLTRSSSG
jgi:uncharacterized protein